MLSIEFNLNPEYSFKVSNVLSGKLFSDACFNKSDRLLIVDWIISIQKWIYI